MVGITHHCTSRVRVRYAETDAMRIAYHANYLVWYEIGRTDLMRELGLSYHEVEQRGYILPVVESGSRYIESALYDDDLEIKTEMVRQSHASLRMDYTILRNGKVINRGFTRHVFLERDTHKLVKIPDFFLQHFQWS